MMMIMSTDQSVFTKVCRAIAVMHKQLYYVVLILYLTISFIRHLCYFNAFPDEETQYKFKKFRNFQFIYFSLLNFKDIFKQNYAA